MTCKEIAEKYGYSYRAVLRVVKALGLSDLPKGRGNEFRATAAQVKKIVAALNPKG
jgi:hypothetical protein